MALKRHDEAADPVAAVHSFQRGDCPLEAVRDHLRFECEVPGQTLQKQLFTKRNQFQRVCPPNFANRPPAPERVDPGLERLGERGIAPENLKRSAVPAGERPVPGARLRDSRIQ